MNVQDGEAYDAYIDGLKRSEVNRMLKPLARTRVTVQERPKARTTRKEEPPSKTVKYGFPILRAIIEMIALMFRVIAGVTVWTVILLIRLVKYVWKALRKSNQNI